MLLTANITNKTLGNKMLFSDLNLILEQDEKVAIVGRNGVGKTTFFRLLAGDDKQFEGSVQARRGTAIIMTAQEHTEHVHMSCVDYILQNLPEFRELHHVIETYPATMGSDMTKITAYTEALARYGELGYYDIEEKVVRALGDYQIDETKARGSLGNLSGGQKRFVELVKVTESNADLALIDEPTNHMDYVAKAAFIEWFKQAPGTVVVITHDRDVLQHVDRIIELKDGKAQSFSGNYDAYLKQNSVSTVTQMGQYEVAQRTLENLQKQIAAARAKKAGSSKTPNPFIILERRLQRQYDQLAAQTKKPSFWVDQDSIEQMSSKVVAKYDRYKDKNIRIATGAQDHGHRKLLSLRGLSLGYTHPLFDNLSLDLSPGERLQIRGRNGAGKTTLLGAIRAELGEGSTEAKRLAGSIEFDPNVRLGVYEQEPDPQYMTMTLGAAVADVYGKRGVAVNDQSIRRVLSDYLFDPILDFKLTLEHLSGGQRARFQLISMLCHRPTLLILDEPTNHLDLPSIEELDKALANFRGAVLYVTHDSYFVEKLGGEVVQIGQV